MSSSFNEETIKYFKDFALCGITRDQVVREMSEFIYIDCDWESSWDRHELLEELIKSVYN